MANIKIFDAEMRFMNLVWDHEPMGSGELVKLCEKELSWKKSTTFTVIRRLCQRGVIQNKDSVIKSLVNREQVQKQESRQHIEKIYSGSLKAFFVSFLQDEKLSQTEIDELRKIVKKVEGVEKLERAESGERGEEDNA